MATKKTKVSDEVLDAYNEERLVSKYDKGAKWPKITHGSHSTRTEYADGRVEFESDWDKLKADVESALAEYAKVKPMKPAVKAKTVKAKKVLAVDGHGDVHDVKPAKITATKKTTKSKK